MIRESVVSLSKLLTAVLDTPLRQVSVWDGGADGDVETPAGAALFAVQGVFVP